MNKLNAALMTLILLGMSQPAFAVAKVAVAHFAPFAETIEGTAVNILVNGETALEGVTYKQFTPYIDFDAGTYMIDVVPVGATEPAISGSFTLTDGNWYTVYAAGNGTTQVLELRALMDNTTAPGMGELNLRVVHAAPFAADLADTEVSIRTDGGDLVNGLAGVPYNGESGFFAVPAGPANVKVSSNDGSANYIDPVEVALPAGADVTVFAIGDGMNQPLGIIAFPVGEIAVEDPIDNRYTGIWEVIEGSGTGFYFFSIPAQNRVVGSWYTYDMAAPTFFTFDSMPGGFTGNMATTDLYLNTGGGNNEDDVVTTEKVGTLDIMFPKCGEAVATVTFTGGEPALFNGAALTQAFPCTD